MNIIFQTIDFFIEQKRLFAALIAVFFIVGTLYGTREKKPKTLYINDFEKESDLDNLNHKCGKLMLLSNKHATHGKSSLLTDLPIGVYPGVSIPLIFISDWSGYDMLRVDVFNPNQAITLAIRIDDTKSWGDYYSRFNSGIKLSNGMNHISIELSTVAHSPKKRQLNMSKIKEIYFFLIKTKRKYKLYFDALRLERR